MRTHSYTSTHLRLSRKLAAPKVFRALLDMHPLMVAVVCIMMTPVGMWVNDISFVHPHFVPFNQQWLSPQFDIALAIAIALLVERLRGVPDEFFPNWLRSWTFHWGVVLGAYVASAMHVWQERGDISTLDRRTGPNSLYHNLFVSPFLGYLLGMLLVAYLTVMFVGRYWYSPAHVAMLALIVVFVSTLALAGRYDDAHQYAPGGVHKSDIANPSDPWCGGLLTRRLCGPPQR